MILIAAMWSAAFLFAMTILLRAIL